MTIIYELNQITKSIFQDVNSLKEMKDALEKYFSFMGVKPEVNIENDYVKVEFDDELFRKVEKDFNKAMAFCDKGEFDNAEPILKAVISKCPLYSEAHRNLGQIYFVRGNVDAAIDELIDALRIDPSNYWALILLGNVFAKAKDDVETATKYYNRALEIDPNNNIAINNIAGNLLQNRKFVEAEPFFHKAIELNNDYPNSHYGLAVVYDETGRYFDAFESALTAAKCNKVDSKLRLHILHLMIETSKKYCKDYNAMNVVLGVKEVLEERGGVSVEMVVDNTIPTAAKFEFAKNNHRRHHVLRYRTGYPNAEHLMLHELMHLELVLEAQEAHENKLYITTKDELNQFYADNAKAINVHISNLGRPKVEEIFSEIFYGLNRQIFNTPIDMFIEDRIYRNYKMIRPFQFLSLFAMQQESIKAVANPKLSKMFPPRIITISRVYNLINAIHFADLYSLNLVGEFKAPKNEFDDAKFLFDQFVDCREDRMAGEEYELVQYFADYLKVNHMFSLVDEDKYYKSADLLESDITPDIEYTEEEKSKQTSFDKKHKDGEDPMLTMMMSMYMVSALEYFEGKSKADIKVTAFEIAMVGASGISPEKKSGYSVPSIPGKDFGGYQFIAYYYVSWAVAIPEMLEQLHLPFSKAYETALQLYKNKQNNGK